MRHHCVCARMPRQGPNDMSQISSASHSTAQVYYDERLADVCGKRKKAFLLRAESKATADHVLARWHVVLSTRRKLAAILNSGSCCQILGDIPESLQNNASERHSWILAILPQKYLLLLPISTYQ